MLGLSEFRYWRRLMLCRPPMSCLRCPIQRVFAAIALLSFGAGLSAQEQTLRVLCYNIHHGEGVDGKVDLIRQSEVINSCSPDLVALQEVDDKTERTGRIDQTARLAELTGLNGRFVHQLDFEGGRYGQAILSKFPISEVTLHWLPGMPDRERRIAGAVVVQVNDLKLTFVTTHLHHNNESFRQQQSSQLNQVFAKHAETLGLPMILAGDLNATPDSQPLRTLREEWQSATEGQADMLTFPAVKPERQLDYILTSPQGRIAVRSVKVINEHVASDHCPLFAEMTIQ